eukprot:gene1631-3162_t
MSEGESSSVAEVSSTSSSKGRGGIGMDSHDELEELLLTGEGVDDLPAVGVGGVNNNTNGNGNGIVVGDYCINMDLIFFATVATWSEISTREIIPWYKGLPLRILGASLRLVQVSRGQAMQASFSVEFLAHEMGTLHVWFANEMDTELVIDHTPLNPAIHGPISFGFGSKIDANDGSSNSSSSSTSLVQNIMKPKSVTECLVQWQPKDITFRQLFVGYVALRIIVGSIATDTQYIPLVCYWNHNSIIKIDKTINFGEIPLGSNIDIKLPITNLSSNEDLVYNARILALRNNTRGNVLISASHTGVIESQGTKTMTLNFSGTSLGKFEQDLIVQNIRDGFDQKRIAITAYVTWPQSEFILLPDFQLDEKGKLSRWDLGLIQVPACNCENIRSTVYKLNINNVSGKILYVTAVSNLKKQCFLYTDENCTQFVVSYPMPIKTLTTLYVLIRPSNILNTGNKSSSTSTAISSTDQRNNSNSNSSNAISKSSVKERRDREELLGKGRELAGGIRLVFYSLQKDKDNDKDKDGDGDRDRLGDGDGALTGAGIEKVQGIPEQELDKKQILETTSTTTMTTTRTTATDTAMLNTPRKMFETSLMFHVCVGSSILRGRILTPRLRCSVLKTRKSSTGIVKGVISLHNASPVFPLRYGYNKNQKLLSSNYILSNIMKAKFKNENDNDTEINSILYILDEVENELQPLQTKVVHYILLINPNGSGLISHTINLINHSTTDLINLVLSIFIDPMKLTSSISKCLLPVKSEYIEGTSISCGSGIRFLKGLFATEIESIRCESPIWLNISESKNNKSIDRNNNYQNQYNHNDSSGNTTTANTNSDKQLVVFGSTEETLCRWQLSNMSTTPFTITPVSDLPINVTYESVVPVSQSHNHTHSHGHMKGSGSGSGDMHHVTDSDTSTIQRRPSLTETTAGSMIGGGGGGRLLIRSNSIRGSKTNNYTSMIGLPEGHWRDGLYRCGDPTTIPPGGVVTICVQAKLGTTVVTEFTPSMMGSLLAGKIESQRGVLAFVTSTQALHSFFDPIVTTNRSENTSSTNGSNNNSNSNSNMATCQSSVVEHLPVATYTRLTCKFVIPKLSIPKPYLQLGTLRRNRRIKTSLHVQNHCDIDLPFRIENLPSWMEYLEDEFERIRSSAVTTAEVAVAEPLLLLRDPKMMTRRTSDNNNMAEQQFDSKYVFNDDSLPPSLSSSSLMPIAPSSCGIRSSSPFDSIRSSNTTTITKSLFYEPGSVLSRSMSPPVDFNIHNCHSPLPTAMTITTLTTSSSHNSPIRRSSSTIFEVPARSTSIITLNIIFNDDLLTTDSAPVNIDYKFKIRLLSLLSSSTSLLYGSNLPQLSHRMHTYDIRISLLVDTSAAIEILTTSGEKIVSKLVDKEKDRGREKDSSSQIFIRRFRDDILVPPYASSSTLTSGGGINANISTILDSATSNSISTKSVVSTHVSGIVSTQMIIRNLLQEYVRIPVQLTLPPDIESFLELELFQQGGLVPATSFDLVPNESVEVRIVGRSRVTGRIPEKLINSVIYTDDNGELTPQDTEEIQLSGSGCWPPTPTTGTLRPGPIVNVSTDQIIFGVDRVQSTSVKLSSHTSSSSSSSSTLPFPTKSPRLSLRQTSCTFEICNPTPTPLSFTIRGYSMRRAGMRLLLDRSVLDCNTNTNTKNDTTVMTMMITTREEYDIYDTVIPLAFPKEGIIAPESSVLITVRLGPGMTVSAQKADADVLVDGSQNLSGMKLKIWDSSWTSHPPQVVNVSLQLDEALPPLLTEAVGVGNNGGGGSGGGGEKYNNENLLNDILVDRDRDLDISPEIKELTANYNENKILSYYIPPKLKLRGVTPCPPNKGQYEICLGQQLQRKESLEWTLTVQNTSENEPLEFKIYAMSSMDESWLELGQRRGDILPGSNISIMLYFSRIRVGIFFTYIVIENISNFGDVIILRVSMEVVQDCNRNTSIGMSSIGDPIKPLFLVKTAVGARSLNSTTVSSSSKGIDKSTSSSILTNKNGHFVEFADVYLGKLYRRRSFVLINISDTALEFKLSSTFPISDLMFTLSPLSLKPCTQLTVEPGEVFVACRLMKNHQESIKVYGRCRRSVLRISLHNTLPSPPPPPPQQQLPPLSPITQRPISTSAGETITSTITSSSHNNNNDNKTELQLFCADSMVEVGNELESKPRWLNSQYICIDCIPQDHPVNLAIYCTMQSFKISVISLTDSSTNNTTSPMNTTSTEDFNSTSKSTATRSPSGKSLWLRITSVPRPQKMNKLEKRHSISEELFAEASGMNGSIEGGIEGDSLCLPEGIFAEEHFTIYNRDRPSEKYRVPVRLVSRDSLLEPAGQLTSLRHREGMAGIGLGSTSLASFSSLEGSIAEFLRQFTSFWPRFLSLQNSSSNSNSTNSNNSNNNTSESALSDSESLNNGGAMGGIRGTKSSSIATTTGSTTSSRDRDSSSSSSSSSSMTFLIGQGPSTALAMQVTASLRNLEGKLNIGDDITIFNTKHDLLLQQQQQQQKRHQNQQLQKNIIIEKNNTNNNNSNSPDNNIIVIDEWSKEFSNILFHFFSLTDELTLHTLRQSSLGNSLMSSVNTGQPAARLAQLLYTVVFGHPIFESFKGNKNQMTIPRILVPFAKQLLYYMGFFPEVDGSMEPLLDICAWLKSAIAPVDWGR